MKENLHSVSSLLLGFISNFLSERRAERKIKTSFSLFPAQTRRGFIAHLRARQTKPLALHRLPNCLFLNGRLHIYHHFKLSGDQSFEFRLCSTIYDTLLLKERLLFFLVF